MASGSIEEPDLRLLFGDLRSGHVLGGGRWRPSVRSGARSGDRHDQDGHRRVGLGSTPSLEGDGVTGGWCRYPSVSRPGKMETFGQVGCTTGADGDLRSGRVLGEDAGTIRMRAQVARSG